MAKYTNNTNAPKNIHTTDRGVVTLPPGASDDLNVSDADAAAMKACGLLDGDANPEAPSLAALQAEIASGATPASLTADAAETDAKAGKGDAKADDKPAK